MSVDQTITPPTTKEDQSVLDWRFDELVRAGFPTCQALAIAVERHVDLHSAVGLVRRGCPPHTAALILL